MTERWVKATNARLHGMEPAPSVWVEMSNARQIAPIDGDNLKSTARSRVTFPDGELWFDEPPEHFLPKKQYADARLFDAMVHIKSLGQFGDHGSVEIATKAIEEWKAALPK